MSDASTGIENQQRTRGATKLNARRVAAEASRLCAR
jgi:hypothetical protein